MKENPGAKASPLATVVLVHGLWMNGLEMGVLGWRLRRCGFAVRQFSYRTVRSDIACNARCLQQFVNAIAGPTVHFVGHSLGGLQILRLFADFPEQRPGRVVLLGTPYAGSATARALARTAVGRCLLGASYGALGDAATRWAGGRDLGIIAGSKSLGLGVLVARLPQPNDGTVALVETQGIMNATQCTHATSHTGLLFSAAVARSVCAFLKTGRFS